MKIIELIMILLLLANHAALGQGSDYPDQFSWDNRFNKTPKVNYISPAKDQGEQGPYSIFAAIGAIEALSQIYYNKPNMVSPLDLSEAELYSWCSQMERTCCPCLIH